MNTFPKPPSLTTVPSVVNGLVQFGSAEVWIFSAFGTSPSKEILPTIEAVAAGGASPPPAAPAPEGASGIEFVDDPPQAPSASSIREQRSKDSFRIIFSRFMNYET
jgi:hypothetical protein